MKVEALNLPISSVFGKGKFIIPNYQREYDWDNENIEEFINDIEDTSIGDNYFIGHMVFNGEYSGNTFEVIDGQQRITTVTILLCCIRDRFYELKEDNLANAIHNKYIFSIDLDNKSFAILENRMPYPILQSRIQSAPKDRDNNAKPQKNGEKKILNTYDIFYKRLAGYNVDELKILRDKVINLETIFVAATGLADASTIFMTLNATGKDLTALDLVKNYVFSKYPTKPHIDEPNDSWKIILQNTIGIHKNNENNRFLNNSFASRYKKVSDKRIYKEVIRQFKNDTIDSKSFILELKEDSEIYKTITQPSPSFFDKNDYDIYESIYAIVVVFKIEVANAFLLSVIREYKKHSISKAMFLYVLKCIEHLHFVNNAICSKRSSGYDSLYAKYAQELFRANDKEQKHAIIKTLSKDLLNRIPEKADFDSSFNKKVFFSSKETKQKNLVQYILNKIERQKNKNAILIQTSIEHIYPENAGSKWGQLRDESNIRCIGNLVLLDRGLNSLIGNDSYQHKRNLINERSSLISTKEIFLREDWNEEAIIERTKSICDYMYSDIWK